MSFSLLNGLLNADEGGVGMGEASVTERLFARDQQGAIFACANAGSKGRTGAPVRVIKSEYIEKSLYLWDNNGTEHSD